MGQIIIEGDTGKVSDGFHTFDELYEHRCLLFVALCRAHSQMSWWSRFHSDGSNYEGWIIAGMALPQGVITYHLPERIIPLLTTISEIPRAPEWDGHTPADVIKRLTEFLS